MNSSDVVYLDVISKFPHATVFVVGGAVRDLIMGKTPQDIDYVITGLTSDEMDTLGWEGYGESFFVYIHPATQAEVALARVERKVSTGYTGFEVYTDSTISIEDDLARRDLTINSMAIDCATGNLHDPYGGKDDILNKVLRPTTDAFMEDPVRSLRVARFMARYGDWSYSVQVKLFTDVMLSEGEFDNIPPSRIQLEVEKAFDTDHPGIFFKTLHELGLMNVLFDECTFDTANNITANTVGVEVSWYPKFISACTTLSPSLVERWNYLRTETLAIITDKSYKHMWYSTPESVCAAVQRHHLFRNLNLLHLLLEIWAARRPSDQNRLTQILKAVIKIERISYSDMIFQHPEKMCVDPKDRAPTLNTYRLDLLLKELSVP